MGVPIEAARFQETAQTVLRQMAERNIPPTPENYSLWFSRINGNGTAAGMAPEAKRHCEHRPRAEPAAPDDRHAAAESDRLEPELIEMSAKVEAVMASLMTNIGAVGQDARNYGQVLGNLADGLNGEVGLGVLQRTVTGILMETHRMLERTKSLEQRLLESSNEVKTLRVQIETTRREALTDSLTGLNNRKALDRILRDAMKDASSGKGELCVLMVDIDHFKRFNDAYGHALGDQVLKLVARTLVENIKGRDFAARYGGEEFCILLPETRLSNAVTLADQLRRAVARKRIVKRGSTEDYGSITLSIGVAVHAPGETASRLVHRADSALYYAKNHGRNRVASEEELPPAPPTSTPLG